MADRTSLDYDEVYRVLSDILEEYLVLLIMDEHNLWTSDSSEVEDQIIDILEAVVHLMDVLRGIIEQDDASSDSAVSSSPDDDPPTSPDDDDPPSLEPNEWDGFS